MLWVIQILISINVAETIHLPGRPMTSMDCTQRGFHFSGTVFQADHFKSRHTVACFIVGRDSLNSKRKNTSTQHQKWHNYTIFIKRKVSNCVCYEVVTCIPQHIFNETPWCRNCQNSYSYILLLQDTSTEIVVYGLHQSV